MQVASAPIRPVVTGPISYSGHAELQRDIANLKSAMAAVGDVEGFLPVVAPASALPNARDAHYGDEESLLFALADALHEEYAAIVDAGLHLQVDDAFLPYMHERLVPPMSLAEYRGWAELRIAALNRALRGLPPGQDALSHLLGKLDGPHMFDVPMKDIVDIVLKVNVGAYAFEAANPRHEHEWQVWKTARPAEGRRLMPGLVAHSTNVVRTPGARRGAAAPLCRAGRPGERDGRHGLRLLPEPALRAGPSQHHVGQAEGAVRGSGDRLFPALELTVTRRRRPASPHGRRPAARRSGVGLPAGGRAAISRIIFLRIASANDLRSLAAITKERGPPVTAWR